MESQLDNIQPNILKSHGRKFVRFLFIQFLDDSSPTELGEKLYQLYFEGDYGFKVVNSTADQLENTTRFNSNRHTVDHQDSIVVNLHLSFNGLSKFESINSGDPNWDLYFRKGMKYFIDTFNDPPADKWGDYDARIDAMISLASNAEKSLEAAESKIREILSPSAQILFTEDGKKLFKGEDAIEPFGFKDNISNPRFFFDYGRHYEAMTSKFKIALDPAGGSYLVFRKLEQDITKFNCKVAALAKALNITKEYAEAQIVGRFKNGVPLTISSNPDLKSKTKEERDLIEEFDHNHIGYEADEQGLKCPYHAHIRKCNPRNERSKILEETAYQGKADHEIFGLIVRRGIPYEEEVNGEKKTGLLFLCYQSDIVHQFVPIQKDWCNHPDSILITEGEFKKKIGLDPISGQYPTNPKIVENSWQKEWGKEGSQKSYHGFQDTVTFKGGEFFYTPPINYIRELGSSRTNIV